MTSASATSILVTNQKMKPLNFTIRYTLICGEIGVLINGVKYRYFLDAGFIPKIERMAKRRPGKALALLKDVAWKYEKEV